MRSLGPEVEGVAGTTCEERTPVPHSPSPNAAWEEVENWRVKLRPVRKEGCGEGDFKF